jgi:hypothetical protein
VLQKQRNGKGRFVTITVLGESKSKGSVIIPEGRDACGWHGLSKEINGIMAAKSAGNRDANHRWPEERQRTVQDNHGSNLVKDAHSFKEAVIQGDGNPNISLSIAGNQGDLSQIGNGSVKDILELSLKVILGIGPGGGWEVKWAGVLPCEDKGLAPPQAHNIKQPEISLKNGPHLNQVPNTARPITSKPNAQPTAPKPKMVWKPRVSGFRSMQKSDEAASGSTTANLDLDRVSIHTCDSDSQLSSESGLLPTPPTTDQPIAEAIQDIGEVDRLWGSSRDWFLDLRDGRRLRLLVDL